MKSKEQIIDYINGQPWAEKFCKNTFLSQNRLVYDKNLINKAFNWTFTEEGVDYWNRINTLYSDWFDRDTRPKSWTEFRERIPKTEEKWVISPFDGRISSGPCLKPSKASCSTKETAEAFLAYMQLIQLREVWLKYEKYTTLSYKIIYENKHIQIMEAVNLDFSGLSFPTNELAQEFLTTFKDLLEIAKPLL